MSVDFGTKRVGVAMADPLRLFSPDEALDVLARVDKDDGLDVVVVGWPLESDGSLGRMTRLVGEYINRIRKRVPDVDIVRRDERNTSERAKELIRDGMRPSLRSTGRERIDTAVAGLLLQEYLDEQRA